MATNNDHLKNSETELTELNKELYKDYVAEQNKEKATASKKKTQPPEVKQLVDMIQGAKYEQTVKGPRGDLHVLSVPNMKQAKLYLNKLRKYKGRAAIREGFFAQVGVAVHGGKLIVGHGLPNYSWDADQVNIKDLK